MSEPHYRANGGTGSPVGTTVDDHFFRRYRELLDDEDHAFDELEHAYEEGNRAHFELDLAAWQSAFEKRMSFLTRHGMAVSPLSV
jgi:hypothetical protein